jgi:TatD DNase family protein
MALGTAFDAHNHVHLSIPKGILPLSDHFHFHSKPIPLNVINHAQSIRNSLHKPLIGGMALMSTQPRDFPIVHHLSKALLLLGTETEDDNDDDNKQDDVHSNPLQVIRCYGVHPWFLKQAKQDFQSIDYLDLEECTFAKTALELAHASMEDVPWLSYLTQTLKADTQSHVGEIGLDSARFDPDTKDLVCPMEEQIIAFEVQMHIAAMLKRSVSIHVVRSWGPLMDALRRVKTSRMKLKKEQKMLRREQMKRNDNNIIVHEEDDILVLPPKIYWHAFGGKAAVVGQLDAICRDYSETYFGFAPVINFRSPKTIDLIREIGINRLVLESDLEDHSEVLNDIEANIDFISAALDMKHQDVIDKTTQNAYNLYLRETKDDV